MTVRPSRPTCHAGTDNFTHCPAAGSAPIERRLAVPLMPHGNRIRAPVRAVFPSAVVPLQHHLARRVRRIEIHVREQRVAGPNRQRPRRIVEIMLMHAGGERGLVRPRPRERRRVARDPVPRVATGAPQRRSRRRRVVHPDRPRRRLARIVPGRAPSVEREGHAAERAPFETDLDAGTDNFTHCPAAGSAPIERRLAVPSMPHAIKLEPQYARCSQVPSYHCSITWLGGFAGSRYTYANRVSADPNRQRPRRVVEIMLMQAGDERRLVRPRPRQSAPGCSSPSSTCHHRRSPAPLLPASRRPPTPSSTQWSGRTSPCKWCSTPASISCVVPTRHPTNSGRRRRCRPTSVVSRP